VFIIISYARAPAKLQNMIVADGEGLKQSDGFGNPAGFQRVSHIQFLKDVLTVPVHGMDTQ